MPDALLVTGELVVYACRHERAIDGGLIVLPPTEKTGERGREDARSRFLPPENELSERFILTGGPGGQHVNRTESGVQLSFNAATSDFLSEPVRARLLKLAGSRADSAGVIMIEARRFRSQHRNREDARVRLAALIERAHHEPRKRIPTQPSRAAREKRLKDKRRRGEAKQRRGGPGLVD